MSRIELDTQRCTGHALCHAVAPAVYDLDDTGYCVPKHAQIDNSMRSDALAGAQACPERALTIDDD
jgi:ferredoxin